MCYKNNWFRCVFSIARLLLHNHRIYIDTAAVVIAAATRFNLYNNNIIPLYVKVDLPRPALAFSVISSLTLVGVFCTVFKQNETVETFNFYDNIYYRASTLIYNQYPDIRYCDYFNLLRIIFTL